MALQINLLKGRPFIMNFSRSLKSWSTNNADEYNNLMKSNVPTDYYQASLPQLPIPRLDLSCQRYLNALRPIISNDEQFTKTMNIVGSFKIGIGQQLQNHLCEKNRALRHTSYIADDWMDSYLSSRLSLPLNFNPFLILRNDPVTEYNQPCIKAANHLISCLRYRRSFIENRLEPDVKKSMDKEIPYDMSQHQNLFGSTRIPALNLDFLQTYPDSKHIIVMKRGRFYYFNALDDSGNLKTPNYIYSCLKYIWDKPDEPENCHKISWLSCLPRDDWARARTHLLENPSNVANFALIDSALTFICFDVDVDFDDITNPRKQREAYGHNALHGNLSSEQFANLQQFPLNRWFDKSFSTIFTKNGASAINFEHSWVDGATMSRFYDRIYSDSTKNHFVSPGDNFDRKVCGEVKEVTFKIDEGFKPHIEAAKRAHENQTNKLELNYIQDCRMNTSYLKSKKLSTDSIFHLAFQMAFFKISAGQTPATYESCSTAHFKHGRTETIRAATSSTQKACKMFHVSREKYVLNDLRSAINESSQTHSVLVKEASLGQGFDRHWFALKKIAEKQGMNDVSIFKDHSYQIANHFILSTSLLFAGNITGGGYGPAVSDGFGLAYGYEDKDLGVFCSNWKDTRNGAEFAQAVEESFKDIHSILEST